MTAVFTAGAVAKLGAPEVLGDQLELWYGLTPSVCRLGVGAVVSLEFAVVALGLVVMRPTRWLMLVSGLVGVVFVETLRLMWMGHGAVSCGCGLPGDATVAGAASRNGALLMLSVTGCLVARTLEWRPRLRQARGMALVGAIAIGAGTVAVGRSRAPVEVANVVSMDGRATGLRAAAVQLSTSDGEPIRFVAVEPSCECLRAWSEPAAAAQPGVVRIWVAEELREPPRISHASMMVRGYAGSVEFRKLVMLW